MIVIVIQVVIIVIILITSLDVADEAAGDLIPPVRVREVPWRRAPDLPILGSPLIVVDS